MPTITLTLPARPERSYPIVIGSNAIGKLPAIVNDVIKGWTPDDFVILYDRAVEGLALEISYMLDETRLIPINSGEPSKNLREAERICGELLRLGVTRDTILICVGGGMLTDLGGFVASTFMRGIRCIHVPTSMLAMTDAAIGGKTGVDLGNVKNIVGAIHHPIAVVADIDALATVPDTGLREGVVEAVKKAAMLDAAVFGWLEQAMPRILARDPEALTQCVADAVRLKGAVVEEDERESGKRMFLNFGHTVGHAVEALSRFAIPHGQAVSIGMRAEMALAGFAEAERVNALMARMQMPLKIPAEMDRAALWDLMTRDKKNVGGAVRMAVPKTLGTGEIRTVDHDAFLTLPASP